MTKIEGYIVDGDLHLSLINAYRWYLSSMILV